MKYNLLYKGVVLLLFYNIDNRTTTVVVRQGCNVGAKPIKEGGNIFCFTQSVFAA